MPVLLYPRPPRLNPEASAIIKATMARALEFYVPLASIAAKAAAITPGAAAGAATITGIPTIGPWDTASHGVASERQAAWGKVGLSWAVGHHHGGGERAGESWD